MSRLASVAVGGYYPFPPHLILPVAHLIDATALRAGGQAAFLDPCVGEGEAILALLRELRGEARLWNLRVYGCELERGRARAATELLGRHTSGGNVLHGDAFRIVEDYKQGSTTRYGASLLWLNPAYHTDRIYGRLEERFLRRFTRMLTPGSGVLVYTIPASSLAASAATLATHYRQIHCFRFPNEDYRAYQQVVVLAVREAHPYQFAIEEHPSYRQILAWAVQPMSIPVLPEPGTVDPLVTLPTSNDAGFAGWRLADFDLGQMRQSYKVHCGGKASKIVPLRFFGADRTMADLIGRAHETAMPPKPGHIASSLAAGLLNGQRIEPDDPATGLPPLLMRGVYQREHQTVETRRSKDGEETGIVQIEQPKLRVAVLDLDALVYYDLQPGTVPTGSTHLAAMNVADVLIRYSRSLAEVMARQCPPLHKIHEPSDHLLLPVMDRLLYRAQGHAVMAALKLLLARHSNVLGLGEVGTGKSTLAMQVVYALSPEHYYDIRAQVEALGHQIFTTVTRPVRNVLVLCPPHLLAEWQNEIQLCLPGARIVVLDVLSDLDRLPEIIPAPGNRQVGHLLTFYLLGRETAKLGHALTSGVWKNRNGVTRCPRCGAPVTLTDREVIKERAVCEARQKTPVSLLAHLAHDLAPLVMPSLNTAAYGWLPPGINRQALHRMGLLGGYSTYLARPEGERAALVASLNPATRAAVERWAAQGLDLPGARAALWHELALTQRFSGQPGTTLDGSRVGRILDALTTAIADVARGYDDSGKPVRVESGWIGGALDVVLRLCLAVAADDRDEWIASFITRIYPLTIRPDGKEPEHVYTIRRGVRRMVFLIHDAARQEGAVAFLKEQRHTEAAKANGDLDRALRRLEHEREEATKPLDQRRRYYDYSYSSGYGRGHERPPWEEFKIDLGGQLTYSGSGHPTMRHGDLRHLEVAMSELMGLGRWRVGPVCGEPLYASTPDPRRVPMATFISRHRKEQFDALIVDEGQDYVEDSNAQTRAAYRLIELGLPVMVLSGSIMRGYASQLHPLLWSLFPDFREVFGRTERKAFVTKYGYRKRLVEEVDERENRRRAPRFGVVTDRVEDSGVRLEMRDIGEAPGILPQLLLDYILPKAVTLHKEDLDTEIPPAVIIPTPIEPETDEDRRLLAANQQLATKILTQIARDTWKSGLAGRLFGALSQATTYLDRCTADVGNVVKPGGVRAWESCYPESIGGGVVATAPLIPADQLTAKERTMLAILNRELAEGNNCIVFIQNSGTPLVARLQRIIQEHTGEAAVFLDAKKAKTKNRREWINEHVVGVGARVLIVNPVTIKTGLNNLVHFNVALYFQLPGGDAEVFRQANGRIHRIGQTKFVRVYPLYYANSAQEWGYLLLMAKVSASLIIDGLDITAALEAAGAGEESAAALLAQEFGQVIYKLMTDPDGAGRALQSLVGIVNQNTQQEQHDAPQESLWAYLAA